MNLTKEQIEHNRRLAESIEYMVPKPLDEIAFPPTGDRTYTPPTYLSLFKEMWGHIKTDWKRFRTLRSLHRGLTVEFEPVKRSRLSIQECKDGSKYIKLDEMLTT